MKTKCLFLIALSMCLSFVASADDITYKITVSVDGADQAQIIYSTGYSQSMSNGGEYQIISSNNIFVQDFNCTNQPILTAHLYDWVPDIQHGGFWNPLTPDHFTMQKGWSGAVFYITARCPPDDARYASVTVVHVSTAYCLSAPRFSANPEESHDWTLFNDSEIYNGTFGCEAAYYFDAPRLHIQTIAYNFPVNFDDFDSYDVTSESIVSQGAGYWDTGIDNTSQVWTRARFEDESGNPLSDWSDVQCVNPLP